MIEEFCKYLFGESIWGIGVVLLFIWSVIFPFFIYNTGVEAFELCKRVRDLERKGE